MRKSLREVTLQYLDNCSYADLASAKLYQEALRQLAILRPKSTLIDGNKVEFDMTIIASELSRVNNYVDGQVASSSASGSRVYDMSQMRD